MPTTQVRAANPFQAADELEVFLHLHLRVQGRSFRQVADSALHFQGVVEHVESGHSGMSGSRRQEAGQNAHGSRLSGAIWAQKADYLTFIDLK